MTKVLEKNIRTMGTLPVFMTAISTILGAILFLRFGYSVAHVGLFMTLMIILLGHLVTIPTAMAVAEVATNQRVEGGGAYFIISRSFGLSIGGAIGIALFLSQAISVAFYVIAFTTSTTALRGMLSADYGVHIPDLYMNYGLMALLSLLMLTKGANVGVKALYLVVAVLVGALVCFFAGSPTAGAPDSITWFQTISSDPFSYFVERTGENVIVTQDNFFAVFTIIFPAFTGIAAGLGLSGDLKDPKKSIPQGTLWATVVGILVYILVAFKLNLSASPEDLAGDELWMQRIAIWGPAIPIGLACAAISSALGSVMIAPRTLQALGADKIFPGKSSLLMAKSRKKNNEPFNATIVTCIIGFLFVSIGELNIVAEVISMFFMLTYGAICMVSFFEHMAASPAYRPTFKSRWYVSLGGGLLSFILMFKMNFTYALISIALMVAIYLWISYSNPNKRGLENLFKGIIFQVTRRLQLLLQKREAQSEEGKWRPFIISISQDSFKRRYGFDMVRWIAHRYGFGTYIHFIEGFLNEETKGKSTQYRQRLIKLADGVKSRVYLDTMISPSYTSAIAQSVQLPGISGKGNNLILFEYSQSDTLNRTQVIDNFQILKAAELDICMLQSTIRGFGYHKSIHIWITSTDFENSNLMILLGYVLMGHPEWKEGELSIFSIYHDSDLAEKAERLDTLIESGRLPITKNNIEMVRQDVTEDFRSAIRQYSADADLTIVGFNDYDVETHGEEFHKGFENQGAVMFVNAHKEVDID